MILSELGDYLRQHGQASLQDMALHFDADPEALRGMLEHWMRKGKVKKRLATSSCGSGGCSQCDPASVEIYRWAGAEETTARSLLRDLNCSRH